tara:strand:+ start:43337 stop:44371 length:1035 start_codon:yes stop_codon:yes gene_type:complete
MSGRTNDRIYMITQGSGQWGGRILLFDVVTSYATNITSTTTAHSVERENRSVSDHIFNRNAIINLQAYVSDAWKSKDKSEDAAQFNRFADDRSVELFNIALDQDYTPNSSIKGYEVFSVAVHDVLYQGKGPAASDYTRQDLKDIINKSYQTFARNQTELSRLSEKNLITNNANNQNAFDDAINTAAQARELLREVKRNRLLCTLVGKYETFQNMALVVFDNPLKVGEGSQALYLNLTFEQQRVATTRQETTIFNTSASEAVDPKDKSKMNTANLESAAVTRYKKILDEALKLDPQLANKFSTTTARILWRDEVAAAAGNLFVTEGSEVGDEYIIDQIVLKKQET